MILIPDNNDILFISRCTFDGCNYQSHFSENLRKHCKIHTSEHKHNLQAKHDHDYIKRNKKSTKLQDIISTDLGTEPTTATTAMSYHNKHHISTAAEQYPPPYASTTLIQVSNYQSVPSANIKMESSVAGVQHHGDSLIGQQMQRAVQNMVPVQSLSETATTPLYQCQQQIDDISGNANSYISL